MEKFTIDSFSEELDQILNIDNSVFVANNKNDQSVYSLILSFTHFFNNLRDTTIISNLISSELEEIKKTNNTKFGQLSGMKIFTDNLFFAFVFEFMQLVRNDKVIRSNTFQKIIKLTNKRTQNDWMALIKKIGSSNNRVYNTLLKLRNNLSFHYFQPKKLFEGYQIAAQNPKNKMYVSLGPKMSSTRYYFCDLANQIAIYKIIEEDFTLSEWRTEIDHLVNLILASTMNIVHKFIISRCAPLVTETEKIIPIEEFVK